MSTTVRTLITDPAVITRVVKAIDGITAAFTVRAICFGPARTPPPIGLTFVRPNRAQVQAREIGPGDCGGLAVNGFRWLLDPGTVWSTVRSLARDTPTVAWRLPSDPASAAPGSGPAPHAVFSFGREYGKFLPYTVVLRSDGAVVVRGERKRIMHRHVLSDRRLQTLMQMARAAGFLRWPAVLVAKSAQAPDASYLAMEFDYKTVLTLPVRTPETRAFCRLLDRLMRASRLRFCPLPNEPIPTPCILLTK